MSFARDVGDLRGSTEREDFRLEYGRWMANTLGVYRHQSPSVLALYQ